MLVDIITAFENRRLRTSLLRSAEQHKKLEETWAAKDVARHEKRAVRQQESEELAIKVR